ncbi:hypothetical protein G6L37_02505 [Agrobacterium rubi]|nr:hypothetical protein [Agrobacterium rubi]NTF24267.1 hypothetical protein [Agrobacterium rubi]
MAEFRLVDTTKVGREDCYHFEGDDGQIAAFHANTDMAWHWVIVAGDPAIVEKVIEKCCDLGFVPDEIAAFEVDLPSPSRRT